MALETAMRMSEMLTLTVAQIDLSRRTIFLDRTKNGSKRQVPTGHKDLRMLKRYANLRGSDLASKMW